PAMNTLRTPYLLVPTSFTNQHVQEAVAGEFGAAQGKRPRHSHVSCRQTRPNAERSGHLFELTDR
ncbi:MAG TPA: hypothetical protein VFX59_06715, partial [Polyangiales bacterium]|nr:hypothetical protein [Polyangiales bacterium]